MRALLDFLGIWFRDLTNGANGASVLTASSLASSANSHPQASAG